MTSLVGRGLLTCIKQVELLAYCSKRCYSKFGPTELKGRSVTAQKWLMRQMKDPYVRLARQEDYRCRSAFKLLEIDKKYDIIKPGNIVIDCGAAPGSWTQVALQKINGQFFFPDNQSKNKNEKQTKTSDKGFVIAIDLLNIHPIEGAVILNNRDFTKGETQSEIKSILQGKKADVIISDMAPNATGLKFVDHKVSVDQVKSVVKFSLEALVDGGTLLMKTFQGSELLKLEENLKTIFETVKWAKPHASRSDSSEVYILARGFGVINRQ